MRQLVYHLYQDADRAELGVFLPRKTGLDPTAKYVAYSG